MNLFAFSIRPLVFCLLFFAAPGHCGTVNFYRFVDLIKRIVLRAIYNYGFLCGYLSDLINALMVSPLHTNNSPVNLLTNDWRLKTKCQRKYFLYEIFQPH